MLTTSLPRCSILVVDDDRDIRESLIDVLEGQGYLVSGAENGQDALEYLRHAPALPELILLDVMMPLMNGIQFRAAQRKNPVWIGIRVLVMTAFSREEMAVRLDGERLD